MSKEKLLELQQQRKNLEQRIENLNAELQVYYDKGFNKSLIDDEGFPRADLDFGELVTYKNLRREFNEKNNDYKDLMKQIEQAMISYHQEIQNNPNVEEEIRQYTEKWKKQQQYKQQPQQEQQQIIQTQSIVHQVQSENTIIKPFAYLEDVVQDSPAFNAGFKVNDYLIRFGLIDHSNHNKLLNLYEYIKNQQNKQINVKVLRPLTQQKISDFDKESYLIFDLTVTPQTWNGKGLLGWKMNII